MSGLEVELASRLGGASCKNARYFSPYPADAQYITSAIRSLHAALNGKKWMLNAESISQETLNCLFDNSTKYISEGSKVDEEGGVTVELIIEGCRSEGGQRVSVVMRSGNRITLDGFFMPNALNLSYKSYVVD
jgi:hypothetical protein